MTKYLAAFSLGVLVGLCVWFVASVTTRTGDWKPSGDGRTIVNTKTGEIRVTATGETVQEYRKRIDEELAAQAATAEKEYQQRETDRQAAARQQQAAEAEKTRQRADAAEQARKQQELAATEAAQQSAENGCHYHAIQIAVLGTLPSEVSGDGQWWSLTSPYRADRFPLRYERDRLVEFLTDSMYRGVLFEPKWTLLRKHLESLVYEQSGEGTMTRTEQQLNESAAAMEAAKLRAQRGPGGN
jgi:hypothetical protein